MPILNKIRAFLDKKRNKRRRLDNQYERDVFIFSELEKLPTNSLLLDAGCGSQRYRGKCAHLNYKAQDFGQYTTDLKK